MRAKEAIEELAKSPEYVALVERVELLASSEEERRIWAQEVQVAFYQVKKLYLRTLAELVNSATSIATKETVAAVIDGEIKIKPPNQLSSHAMRTFLDISRVMETEAEKRMPVFWRILLLLREKSQQNKVVL